MCKLKYKVLPIVFSRVFCPFNISTLNIQSQQANIPNELGQYMDALATSTRQESGGSQFNGAVAGSRHLQAGK